jgi:NodT family efflux transporter outer membrane factor (OMF) lipoprotein
MINMFFPYHNLRRWLGLAAILSLAACSFVSEPPPSPVTLPDDFSASGEQLLPDRWWESFADSQLDELIEQALAGNFSLQVAWDRLDQSEAMARKAGAELSPSLDIEGRNARTWLRGDGSNATSHDYSLGLTAGYELDLWGRIRSRHDAALLDLQASAEDLHAAGLTLSALVASTWYQLVEQAGQVKLLEEQIATNSKVLELITLQFRTGQIGIADVLQQRQLIETNRGEMAQVVARVQTLEHQLAILLGETPDRRVASPRDEFVSLPALPEAGTPASLVQRRPDVRSAWNRVRAADYRVAEAVADRFPRFALSGRVESSSNHASDMFDNWISSLAANMLGPVIDGGQRRAEVDRTRAVAAEALHSYGQLVLESFGEVEDALVQERQQRAFLASLDKQLELAIQSTQRIRDRYIKGAEDYQRVLTALLSYQTLQRRKLTAERNLFEFRIALCRALGGSWEMQRSDG